MGAEGWEWEKEEQSKDGNARVRHKCCIEEPVGLTLVVIGSGV